MRAISKRQVASGTLDDHVKEVGTNRVWERFLTPRDRQVLQHARWGRQRALGRRPCILVVDMQYMLCGERDEDILEMMKTWPGGCGREAWTGIRNQAALLAKARGLGVPVIYTRTLGPPLVVATAFEGKIRQPGAVAHNKKAREIVAEVVPAPNDVVLDKYSASAVFGTPLVAFLTAMRVDTVLLAGNSTSGCVRATAVDLASSNFTVAVIEDCVFDRLQLAHAASLLDLWMKYCDVVSLDQSLTYLESTVRGNTTPSEIAARSGKV